MSSGYLLYWGADNTASATTMEEVDEILDRVSAAGPNMVDLTADGNDDAGLQIGVGHPHRAVVLIFDEDGGYIWQPDVPEWKESIEFSYGGQPAVYSPARTRITPVAARRAVGEYLRTGALPADMRVDPEN
ncbi:Imm1 family immunity protein [Solwaraspora sp. WMMA2065]|uniref:Imm1 family immunity protein n=1 Tax=Solwaraspora sp. WMMA2065 TaxID=3015166 RepID=UPI00259B1B22|nr:Imm1 family immunity protein [Solwaraspora sp. WMMA2065]WJK33353.1 Imm1 family immunity protein [Solwaraspora sp. WMMA2065]